jgi:hypothetical protein
MFNENPIHLDPKPVPTKQSYIQQHESPIPVFKKSQKKPSKHEIPGCSSSPPFVPHDVNNTTDYYEPPQFPDDRSISSRLERKDRWIDILKVEVEEFKILDKHIKNENATLKDRCAQLQRKVDELTVHKEKLQKLFKRKHSRIESLASQN